MIEIASILVELPRQHAFQRSGICKDNYTSKKGDERAGNGM